MGRSRFKRTAAILAACVAVHLALLSVLAIEATGSHLAEQADQTAIQVTLERPPTPPPVQPRPVERPRMPPPVRGVAAPPAPAPVVHAPEQTSAQPSLPRNPPAVDNGAAAVMGDLVRALRGSVGCSDPDAVGLTPAERDACRRRLQAQGENVKPMSGLTAEKQNRFDRASNCRKEYYDAPIPPGASHSNAAGGIAGLGYQPRLRDCPPTDQ